MKVYFKEMDDPTNFATLFYSPRPDRDPPHFSTSPLLEEVRIDGVNPLKFRFYRYVDDTDPWKADG